MKKKYDDCSEWCLKVRVQQIRAEDPMAVVSDAADPIIHCDGAVKPSLLILMDLFKEHPEQAFGVRDLAATINARWPGTIGGKATGSQTDTTMEHLLTKLTLIGVLDRVKRQGDYQYSFSPKVIEVGLETFIFNNSHFVNTVLLKGQLGL